MKYLLDTCVLSELIKPEPHIQVNEWMINANESELFISVFTIGELRKGIDKLTPGKQRQHLNQWFQEIMEWSENRTLSFEKNAAKKWGSLLAQCESIGRAVPLVDSMIAAIAATNECTVVTRNTKDFSDLEVTVFNPWNDQESTK